MKTERTRVRRSPQRASYDRRLLDAILDEAMVAHLGIADGDQPFVIPTLHARIGDVVYVHGSSASRTMRHLGAGREVCLTVTLLDGLVVARSAFNLSVNYRSAVVLGVAEPVTEREEKLAALAAFTNQIVPGRWDDVRPPSDQELRATAILRIPLREASVKTRTGPVTEGPEDAAFGGWAGVIPMTTRFGPPQSADDLAAGVQMPDYLRRYARPASAPIG